MHQIRRVPLYFALTLAVSLGWFLGESIITFIDEYFTFILLPPEQVFTDLAECEHLVSSINQCKESTN